MRNALLVGIDHYDWGNGTGRLECCINDANDMAAELEKDYQGSENFNITTLTSDQKSVTKAQLFKDIRELFSKEADVALLFFSGHGGDSDLGGYLVTEDSQVHDMGVALNEVVELANLATHITEIIIIVDACYSGHAGNTDPTQNNIASLRMGVSILASSKRTQYSVEKNGNGLFTALLLEALRGGGADVLGDVTVAGIYNYVDKALGPLQQRPVFKSHISELNTIKKQKPQISEKKLKHLLKLFPDIDDRYKLTPAHEPTAAPKHLKKEAIFGFLQKCRANNLIEPIGEEHMYDAAMKKKYCQLTPVGRLYWKRLKNDKQKKNGQ